MIKSSNWATSFFVVFLVITIIVWTLRGFRILAVLPGAVIWICLLLTISAGIIASLQRTR